MKERKLSPIYLVYRHNIVVSASFSLHVIMSGLSKFKVKVEEMLNSLQCVLFSVYCIYAQCAVYNGQCVLQCVLYSVHCTVCTVQCTV